MILSLIMSSSKYLVSWNSKKGRLSAIKYLSWLCSDSVVSIFMKHKQPHHCSAVSALYIVLVTGTFHNTSCIRVTYLLLSWYLYASSDLIPMQDDCLPHFPLNSSYVSCREPLTCGCLRPILFLGFNNEVVSQRSVRMMLLQYDYYYCCACEGCWNTAREVSRTCGIPPRVIRGGARVVCS